MHFVFVSYNYSPGFNTPADWIDRIKAYTGSLEVLAKTDTVTRVEQINYEGDYLHNGIRYCFTKFGKPHSLFPHKLNRFIKQLKPDVVVVHGSHYPLQVMQLHAILPKQTKIIAQHHAEQPLTGIKRYLQRFADNYIDAYLFASKALGMEWVNKGNLASPQKIHEVMEVSSVFYPFDKEIAKSKTGVTGQPVFLWVGRLNQNKDPLLVIKAFLKFVKQQPAARLYMVYHTDELLPEIRELLAGHANKNAIALIGKVPNEDLLYWYNSADFIVSGSHYEGSGTAVCEAMSCGCIPVVTNIFSFRMITDDGHCGLLYDAGNEEALLTTLLQTTHMDMAVKQNKCLAYFKSNLSFEAIARQIQVVAASL